jgi:ABC-type transport system involved in multi-copper enzyme maturation permease subunit
MNASRILFRREVRSRLATPSFHAMGAIFLLVAGLAFWVFAVTMAGKGMLTSEITFSGMLFWMAFLSVSSAVSVKLLGDEQDRGTMELLLTAPVSEVGVILAKSMAGFALILLLAFPAVMFPWILRAVYPAWQGVDVAMWLVGILLLVLVSGLVTLFGMFWSQVFRSQTAAMVATFLTGAIVIFRGSLRSWIGGSSADGSAGLVAVASHVSGFASGMLDSRPLVFYATAMAVLFFLNVRMLQLARFRRPSGGLNVGVSLLLAGVLAALVNYLALLHPLRADVGTLGAAPLSAVVARTLETITSPVRLILLVPAGDPAAITARRVVEKYRFVHPALKVEIVDPGLELARTRELVGRYTIRESSVLVVACGERFKVLPLRALEHAARDGGRQGRRGATFFTALDSALRSALMSLTVETAPVVYFLTGHDERDIADFTQYRGYSEIAGIISDRHAEVRSLLLESALPVTNDCSVLVVAGPARRLAAWEVAKLREFLARRGHLMVLLDSGQETGLEPLLEEWGVSLGQDRILDSQMASLLPGIRDRSAALGLGEVPVIRYGKHPITDGLDGIVSTFVVPRSVVPLAGNGSGGHISDQADKPRVTVLAETSARSWAEIDFNQNPPQFNEGYDRRGPLSLAVCVEKGVSSPLSMDIKPVRIMVVGDSQFAANHCLTGGNESFFVNALEWLLERDAHATAPTGQSGLYTLQIEGRGRTLTFLLIVIAVPGALMGLAFCVALARRDRRAPRVASGGKKGVGL